MKKKTMFKAFNALVRASAKEIRWNDGSAYIPARKPLNGKYMRHAMHVARVYQSNHPSAGFFPIIWTPDGQMCEAIRESFIFCGTPKFSNKHKYVLVWKDDNKYFAVCRADTAEQNR